MGTSEFYPTKHYENYSYLFESHTRYPNPHCGIQLRPSFWPESQGLAQREQAIAGAILIEAREEISTYKRARNHQDYDMTPVERNEAITKYNQRSTGYQPFWRDIAFAKAVSFADYYTGEQGSEAPAGETGVGIGSSATTETEPMLHPMPTLEEDYVEVEAPILDTSGFGSQVTASTADNGGNAAGPSDWVIDPLVLEGQEPPQGLGLQSEAEIWAQSRPIE